MPEIVRKLPIATDPARAFAEISTRAGLERWLSGEVAGDPRLGVRLGFSLGALSLAVVVAELEAPERITWRCVGGPDDWIGTDISIRLVQQGETTLLEFSHRRWREDNSSFREAEGEWDAALERLRNRLN